MINGLFAAKEKSLKRSDKIFLTSSDAISGRTLMIEEDAFNVWVYMLRLDKKGIDFNGFLCTVINPKLSTIKVNENTNKDKALPKKYINSCGYIKNLKKKDISIHWHKDYASILIKNKVYLVMDITSRMGYSRGLSGSCEYGKPLED